MPKGTKSNSPIRQFQCPRKMVINFLFYGQETHNIECNYSGLGKEVLDKSKKELGSIVTEEIWQKIQELLKSEKTDKKVSVDIDVTDVDKEKRTSIHKTIKEEFGSAVISTTATVGEKKFIQCFKAKGHGRNT